MSAGWVDGRAAGLGVWVLEASFGVVTVMGGARGVLRVHLGRRGRERPALAAAARGFARRHPWADEAVRLLRAYLAGEVVSFDGVPVDLDGQPPFRRRVLEECRAVPYGAVVTYRELAARAGNPLAVRAVGSAMSHNPVPILIPCHRVLRTGGALGGFSAPGGVNVKRALLELEERALAARDWGEPAGGTAGD
jgi:methylated-DNA-[protein]-cysteine S-methyltransferase